MLSVSRPIDDMSLPYADVHVVSELVMVGDGVLASTLSSSSSYQIAKAPLNISSMHVRFIKFLCIV